MESTSICTGAHKQDTKHFAFPLQTLHFGPRRERIEFGFDLGPVNFSKASA